MTMEKIKSLKLRTKANEVDEEKGIVTVAVNGIGVKDSQNDISMPGSFNKTLRENMNRMRWFLNHRTDQLLGVPLSGEERDGNLIMTGKINLEKQIGRDTFADYKLYAENGRTLEHSIGVQAIKRDSVDSCKVLEWKMFEYSTLTAWGSNPQTFLVNLKSATADQVRDAVDFIRKAFKERGYSDERLKNYDMELNLLLKALNGDDIVTCPHCNHQFDYKEQFQHSFSQQVLDYANDYTRWLTERIVAEQIRALEPEVREEVTAIIDAIKAKGEEINEKSIADVMEYVRCPNCWAKGYKANKIIQEPASDSSVEPSDDTQPKNDKEDMELKSEAADSTSFFGGLNDLLNNK